MELSRWMEVGWRLSTGIGEVYIELDGEQGADRQAC